MRFQTTIEDIQLCSVIKVMVWAPPQQSFESLPHVTRGSSDPWEKVTMVDFALINLDGGKNLAMNFSSTSSLALRLDLDVIGVMFLPYLLIKMEKL